MPLVTVLIMTPAAAASVADGWPRTRAGKSARGAFGAAVLSVVLLMTSCGGDDGGGGLAQPAPSEDVVCLGGSYESMEEGVTVPRDEACPQDFPSASAPTSTSASPTPASGPTWEPAAAFLSPEAAAQAELPGWRVDEEYEPEAGPLLDPCGEADFPRAENVVASDERAIGSQREAGGSRLTQEVFRYSSPQAAAGALAGYADAVERCPERQSPQAPEGYTDRYSVVELTEADGVQRLLVRRQPCAPQGQCTAHFRTYLVAAKAGDGVTVADYGIGEDGDPQDDARALLVAAAEQLTAAVECE